MADAHTEQETDASRGQWFAATHWSVVLAAGQSDPRRRAQALETLCRTYWEPLYAYIRRLGYDTHDAQDVTQAFFAHLLSEDRLAGVTPEKGKFRSFLLASLKHFICDDRDRAHAAKRGGGQVIIPLEPEMAENHFAHESAADGTAEHIFDRRWAMTVLHGAFTRLQAEFTAADKRQHFEQLAMFLSREGSASDYEAVAPKLRMRPGAVAVAVHRLRHRYRDIIRAEIAQTVSTPAEVDDEMHYLLELICQ